MNRFASGWNRAPLAGWLGLAVVWSAAFWVWLLMVTIRGGWVLGALAVGVRLVLTLGLGVGLCALEKWAWAAAVCLAGVYTAAAGILAGAATWTCLSARPGTLSWVPLLWGLGIDRLFAVAAVAWPVALLSAAMLWLLWREQSHFNIPDRRAYTALLKDGPWPALLIAMCDGLLLFTWYGTAVR